VTTALPGGDGLASGNLVEPRAKSGALLKLPSFSMDVTERLLKDILGGRHIAEVLAQIGVEARSEAIDEFGEKPSVAARSIFEQEGFAAHFPQGVVWAAGGVEMHVSSRIQRSVLSPEVRWIAPEGDSEEATRVPNGSGRGSSREMGRIALEIRPEAEDACHRGR